MSERERFYRFMYYDLFLGGLNIYFRKKIVVEVKIKKDKESQCWGHGEPYCTPTFPFILFSSFPSSLLLLILLSTPFLLPRSLECPFFKKGLFWTLWSLFSGTSCLPTYSLFMFVLFSFISGITNIIWGHPVVTWEGICGIWKLIVRELLGIMQILLESSCLLLSMISWL